ncbi:hypothetical protein E2C01_051963 [Portunus trituberculatus]|uniref:Uncharacterized protein n=1 Tax=Portunus trituberculatus TaxID=210409 RepID=A0A5B7GD67_PORTR|nr:hypothetical protein [Portunus trituberculatus]
MRIEKVGGNREGATVSYLRQLCFGEEKKMRFSRGEVVFHRSKTANVAELNVETVEGGVKAFVIFNRRGVRPGDIFGPLPRGGLRGVSVAREFVQRRATARNTTALLLATAPPSPAAGHHPSQPARPQASGRRPSQPGHRPPPSHPCHQSLRSLARHVLWPAFSQHQNKPRRRALSTCPTAQSFNLVM